MGSHACVDLEERRCSNIRRRVYFVLWKSNIIYSPSQLCHWNKKPEFHFIVCVKCIKCLVLSCCIHNSSLSPAVEVLKIAQFRRKHFLFSYFKYFVKVIFFFLIKVSKSLTLNYSSHMHDRSNLNLVGGYEARRLFRLETLRAPLPQQGLYSKMFYTFKRSKWLLLHLTDESSQVKMA